MQELNTTDSTYDKSWAKLFLLLTIAVNISGMWIPIIGPDGALYASIAKLMVQRNDFVNLIVDGKDWLDKPHLPFWITAFSFKIFGFTTWAYKLPAVLIMMLGARFTYLLAKYLYTPNVAIWSAIILLSAQHIIISNNDVRAEPYLTTFIVGSLYFFIRGYTENKWSSVVAGALLSAMAVMTKGPFAIIPIMAGMGGHYMIKKKIVQLFTFKSLFAFVLILLFISPELYCLWKQFDSHPEKIVFGQTGVSGIKFFFWDSQFGRFLNTGPIKGKGDPFFFFHTLLWAFLPWSLLMYAALIKQVKNNWRNPGRYIEWYCFFGAIISLLIFSLSKFQLPHYANIIFPFLSIILAQYLHNISSDTTWKKVDLVQWVICVLYLAAPIVLYIVAKPVSNNWLLISIIATFLISTYVYKHVSSSRKEKILGRTVFAAALFNLFLNIVFYPFLLNYQSGSEAAFYSNKNFPGTPVVQLSKDYSYALEFYLDAPLITIDNLQHLEQLKTGPKLVYIIADSSNGLSGTELNQFSHFPISRLDGKFINEDSREKSIRIYKLFLTGK